VRAATLSGSGIYLTWVTIPGLIYQVQYATNLAGGSWHNVGSALTATNSATALSDNQPPDERRFYRIVLAQ
jgi:hypothetical protein